MRTLFFLIFLLIYFPSVLAMDAPILEIENNYTTYNLAKYMEMVIDKTHQFTINDVANPNFTGFVPYNFDVQRRRDNYGQTVWLRFQIENKTNHDICTFLTMDFPNPYTGWTLYKQDQSGLQQIRILPKTLHIYLFPLDIDSHSKQTFYLVNYSEGWLQTTFELKKPYIHLLNQIDWFFLVGIQYGIVLALLFYSIVTYLFLRDKIYLIYIFFVFSVLIAFTLMDGLLNRLPFVEISNWFYTHSYRFMLIIAGFFYILFVKYLLHTKKYVPRINSVLKLHLILALPLAIFSWISLNNSRLVYLEVISNALYLLLSFILAFITSIFVLRKGYKPTKYYLTGISIMLCTAIVYFLMSQNIISFNIFVFRLPQLSIDIDMLLQAIALAVRFNLIQQEKIETQREIILQKDLNVKLQNSALKEKEQLITAYARFFPSRFLHLLNKKSILDIKLGDQTERKMTVLFADLRNFTSILETKTPADSFKFINSYLNDIGPIIRRYNGVVDKYIGDAILALYESPSETLFTAIEITKILRQKEKITSQEQIIDMGIGIHYGNLMLGTIGEEERMDGTVISDTVNIAARLEDLNKIYGTHIIISEEVLVSLQDKHSFNIRFIDHLFVKGKKKSVKLYEVFNNDSPDLIHKKLATLSIYHNAIEYYQTRQFKRALNIFQDCLKIIPDDKIFLLYLDRIKHLIIHTPPNWQPIARAKSNIEINY